MMKSNRAFIKFYMLQKNKQFNHELYNDLDFEDVDTWSTLAVKAVKEALAKNLGKTWSDVTDATLCPQCLMQMYILKNGAEVDCDECHYGRVHGKCSDDYNSTYKMIIRGNNLPEYGMCKDIFKDLQSLIEYNL